MACTVVATNQQGPLGISRGGVATTPLIPSRLVPGAIRRAGDAILAVAGLAQTVAAPSAAYLVAIVGTAHAVLVDVAGTIVIAARRVVRGLELPHHLVVFVIEEVTVKRKLSGVVLEPHDHAHLRVRRHLHRVFPGVAFPRLQCDRRAGGQVHLVEHLEHHQVHVHRVHRRARVLELPDLGLAEDGHFGDVVPMLANHVAGGIEGFHQPLLAGAGLVHPVEQEPPRAGGLCLRDRCNRPQGRGQRCGITRSAGHHELHDVGQLRR